MAKGNGDGEQGNQSADREVPPVSPDHAFATEDKRQNGRNVATAAHSAPPRKNKRTPFDSKGIGPRTQMTALI